MEEMTGDEGMHGCNYLLTVDVDMEPLPGYRYANWDLGYGDFHCVPDMSTLRVIPWLEKTALVICDVYTEEGDVVDVSPRQILKRQIERASDAGYSFMCGSELEFFLFKDSFEEAGNKGYKNLVPHSAHIQDYHILQTTRDEYLIRQIRNGMDGAAVPVEFSKGEFGRGQQEINLRFADALEMADRHTIYKNGVKEIADLNGRAVTFMAKHSMEEAGSSFHLHASIWDDEGKDSMMWDKDAQDHMSKTFRNFLGGWIAAGRELAWMYAPYVNSYKRYQPESWAPTALAWGIDNRTCGYRLVGHGKSFRVESRIPGAEREPLPGFRGHHRCRIAWDRERDRASRSVQRQCLRGRGRRTGPMEHRRGNHGTRELQDRPRCVRRGRSLPSREHGEAGMGSLQSDDHRLGAATELRADLTPE